MREDVLSSLSWGIAEAEPPVACPWLCQPILEYITLLDDLLKCVQLLQNDCAPWRIFEGVQGILLLHL